MFRKLSLDVYAKPKMAVIFFLGIASGLPLAIIGSTLNTWLADVGITKSTIGLFAMITLPYSLKFIWAPLIDQVPIPYLSRYLGRRRAWMLVAQFFLLALISCMATLDPTKQLMSMAILAFCITFSSATQDVAVDAYRIERLATEEQGAGAAMAVFGYRVGYQMIGGALGLILADYLGWKTTYHIMGLLLIIGMITVLFCHEPQHKTSPIPWVKPSSRKMHRYLLTTITILLSTFVALTTYTGIKLYVLTQSFGAMISTLPMSVWSDYEFIWFASGFFTLTISILYYSNISLDESFIAPFKNFAQKKGWIIILSFIMFFKFGDAFAGLMRNPFLLELGFSKTELAHISKLYGFSAIIIGSFIGGFLVARIGLLPALWASGILQLLSNLIFIWQAHAGYDIPTLIICITVEDLSGGIGSAAFVAYISCLCNTRYTGTQYSLLSSFASIGRVTLSSASGMLADAVSWTHFFVISSLVAVPGLICLYILQTYYPNPIEEHEAD